MPDERRWVEANRQWWDERAPSHASSQFYDLKSFRKGRDDLRPFERDELGIDPQGLDLLHLQCHLGTDTLSWAQRGARVVGLDFSAPAIDAARDSARELGLSERAEFVVADVYDAVRALGGRTFDIVYTGVGALSWLPDINRWAMVAAGLVRPGGVLYVVEIHPFLWTFDDTPEPELRFPYFGDVESDDAFGSYTDRQLETEHNHVFEHNWSMGPVITAVVQAGLVLEHVGEHPMGVEQKWPFMVRGPDGFWNMPADRPSIPQLWSLRARRPVAA
ncbi:MAG TPA: class I SAM-dependent methyltransferase [Acidimicrobiales bacterium]|jgi:SAM-dependent methyltransferase|nr:class I SAM-dependent methyltransferase [Acidimicrobiales bacterium]